MRQPFKPVPHRAEIARFGRLYSDATNDLIAILSNINLFSRTEISANSAQRKSERRVDKLTRDMLSLTKSTMTKTYKSAALVTKTQLEILGDKPDDNFKKSTHAESIENGIDLMADFFIKANASMKMTIKQFANMIRYASKSIVSITEFQAGWGPSAEEWIDDVARYAIESQLARRTVTKQIMSYLENSLKTGKFIQINGRRYQTRKYAEMVSRTRFRMMQSEAVRNQCAEYAHDLVEISDHGTETEICEQYEGNTYSLTGATRGYEILDTEPPFHPNCLHYMFPTSEAAIEARAQIGSGV